MATREALPDIDRADGYLALAGAEDLQTELEVIADEEDVQVIPLEIGKPEAVKFSGWSQGKRNFTRVALKVLTDIYDKKLSFDGCDANDASSPVMDSEEPMRLPKKTVAAVPKPAQSNVPSKSTVVPKRVSVRKRSTSQSTSSTYTRTSTSGTPNLMPKDATLRQKANAASIMGVVAFRKIYMSKLMALSGPESREGSDRNGAQSKNENEALHEEDLLPITPRFSAKLSPEAQFSMLKGYEDKLICDLKSAYPEQRKTMVRVRTPPLGRSIHMSTTAGTSRPGSKLRPISRSFPQEGGGAGYSLPHPANDAYSKKEMGYHSQLKVTGQVETAIDILDHLRGTCGHHMISPRVHIGQKIEPVSTYNAWTHQWAQQFKIGKRNFDK